MAHSWIVPLAFLGLAISAYIHSSKKSNQKLICALGGSCNEVTESKYSRTCGIPNEVGGMVYFVIVMALAMLSILGIGGYSSISVTSVLIALSVIGSLFSVYLLSLQAFVIRKWCEYCITTALITFLILIILIFF